jgi:hypothetical protein
MVFSRAHVYDLGGVYWWDFMYSGHHLFDLATNNRASYVGFYICFLGTIIKQRTCSPFFFYEKQIVCLGNVSTLQFL